MSAGPVNPLNPVNAVDPVKFAYWVPHVSGGLVTSTSEQRTDWGDDYNRELAVLAESNGFDYSAAAGAMVGRVCDWYFSNGKDCDRVVEQIAERIVACKRPGVDRFLLARLADTGTATEPQSVSAHV